MITLTHAAACTPVASPDSPVEGATHAGAGADAKGKGARASSPAFAALLGIAIDGKALPARTAAAVAADAKANAEDGVENAKTDAILPADATAAMIAAAQAVPALATTVAAVPAAPSDAATAQAKPVAAALPSDAAPTARAATQAAAPQANDPKGAVNEVAEAPVTPADDAKLPVRRDARPAASDLAANAQAAANAAAPEAKPVQAAANAVVAFTPPAPATPAAAAMQAQVAVPVHAPEFPREFAAQVHVAVQRGVDNASIAVHPPELGPIEVRLEVSNGEARLHFAAEAPATRDAIADSIPRLRELLGAQGLSLSDTSVGTQLPQRESSTSGEQAASTPSPRAAAESTPAAPAIAAPGAATTVRLLDVYA